MATTIHFETKLVKDRMTMAVLKKIKVWAGGYAQASAMIDIEHEIKAGIRKRIMTNSISPKKKSLSNIAKAIRKFHGYSGSMPLYESGVFAGSFVTIKQASSPKLNKSVVTAGHNLISKGGYSQSASDLLKTAEEGRTIPVTLKMIRFISFVAKKYGIRRKKASEGGVKFIKIPSRPIIKPVTNYLKTTRTIDKVAKKHITWK